MFYRITLHCITFVSYIISQIISYIRYHIIFFLKEICRVLIGWQPLSKFPYPMAGFFNLLLNPELPFDRTKYLSNIQPWDMGYAHLGVG